MESEILLEHPPPLTPARVGPTREPRRAVPRPKQRQVPASVLLALVLVLLWLFVAPNSPDLAAQAYRSRLFDGAGFALWDNYWYGGHHLLGYSLLYPWAALVLGMRLAGALAVLISSWAFERIALYVYGPRARWGALCFVLAAAGDLWIGRLTFALGATFALLAVLTLMRKHMLLAALLALASAASSPVAGLLLAFAGVTHALCERRLRAALALAAPPLAVVLGLQALFPEGGWEPFSAGSVIATIAVTLAFVWALPAKERLLRQGALLYGAVTLVSLVPTPMGSNVQRYAVLLAAPLLLCALGRRGFSSPKRPLALVLAALCGILLWTLWGPVRQTVQVLRDPSTDASYYAPVRRFLAARAHVPVRIEVPFTKSHWDAALLAQYVPIARGWERQLDKRYNEAIEADPLPAAVYRRWLERNAVSYVALSDAPLDGSSVGEAALIRRGVPYLREVLRTPHWRVFRVLDATPLVSPPAKLLQLGHDFFTLRFSSAGTSVVRVRFTPYWAPLEGLACLSEGPEGWTRVSAARAGVVRVGARFSLLRGLGLAGGCP